MTNRRPLLATARRGCVPPQPLALRGVLCIASLLLALATPGRAASFGGGDFQVNTYSTGMQWIFLPKSVASENNGDFVVVWSSSGQDGSDFGVFGQRYASSGAAVGSEFQVNTATLNAQQTASVAADDDGDFVVAWASYGQDGSDLGIFGQRYDSSGAAVGTEFQVNSYTSGFQTEPRVDTDADGDFVVTWTGEGMGDDLGVFGQRYDSSGAAVGTEFQINTFTVDEQIRPDVATDSNGNSVVVWFSQDQDGSAAGIFGQRYDSSGATAGTEFQINTYTTGGQFGPTVAGESNGDFVVAWVDLGQDPQGGIFARRFDSSGATVGGEFHVNTYVKGTQSGASIAADDDGDFVVAWANLETPSGMFAQRYDSSGAPLGSEFRISTDIPDVGSPGVAIIDESDFVAVWSTAEVFGRLFASRCPIVPIADCTAGFAKGLFLLRESSGSEKLIAKMIKGPGITQPFFGDPLGVGGTAYRLCIYDDATNLVGDLEVDQAGASTWKSVGPDPPEGKGYAYYDQTLASEGVAQILLKGGPASAGKSKILIKGRGANLPGGITSQLTTTSAVTVQLLGDDAPGDGCFSIELGDIKKQESDSFKAK